MSSRLCSGLINVFLYKTEPNPIWRNEELPWRRSDGTVIRRPQLAIDLYYLLSFYGDDEKQIPNLLLGAALAALHAEPHPHPDHVPGSARTAQSSRVLQVRFSPPVTVATAAEILLNASPTPAGTPDGGTAGRRGYVFHGMVDPAQPDLLEIEAEVAPGRYLVISSGALC